MELQPIGNKVLIRLADAEEVTPSGLHIPERARDKLPQKAVVEAVGPGELKNGVRMPMTVKVGDKVLVDKYHGQTVDDGLTRLIVLESSILAVLENSDGR